MQSTPNTLTQNQLLSGLPRLSFQRLAQHLEPVTLRYEQVLYEPGCEIDYVYFPYGSVVSLLSVLGSRQTVEVAAVGSEGMIGASVAFGIDTAALRAIVQVSGQAARMSAARMRKEFITHGARSPGLLRFNDGLMQQVAQSAACNRFHKVEARLARWLLATSDKASSQRIYVTQEFLSRILGVRRVGVSAAAANLQDSGLISYSRGTIALLNRTGLQASACECYHAIHARHLHPVPALSALVD